jgi:hypothetical protein
MKITEVLTNDPIIHQYSDWLAAAGGELRLRILCLIHRAQKLTNGDMIQLLNLESSTASNNLRDMKNRGLLGKQDIRARITWYFIAPEARLFADMLVGLIGGSSTVINADLARYEEMYAKKELPCQNL